jgi:hypothetical protein
MRFFTTLRSILNDKTRRSGSVCHPDEGGISTNRSAGFMRLTASNRFAGFDFVEPIYWFLHSFEIDFVEPLR